MDEGRTRSEPRASQSMLGEIGSALDPPRFMPALSLSPPAGRPEAWSGGGAGLGDMEARMDAGLQAAGLQVPRGTGDGAGMGLTPRTPGGVAVRVTPPAGATPIRQSGKVVAPASSREFAREGGPERENWGPSPGAGASAGDAAAAETPRDPFGESLDALQQSVATVHAATERPVSRDHQILRSLAGHTESEEDQNVLLSLHLPSEQKLSAALRIAQASAQQTRTVAAALDQSRRVTSAMEAQIAQLDAYGAQQAQNVAAAQERAAHFEEVAQSATLLLETARADLVRQRQQSESALENLRTELEAARKADRDDRTVLEEEISQLRERGPAAERQLAEEHLRHGESLAALQLELIDERDRAHDAHARLEAAEYAHQAELQAEREEWRRKLEAATAQVEAQRVVLNQTARRNVLGGGTAPGLDAGWAAYESELHSSGALFRSAAQAVHDREAVGARWIRQRMREMCDCTNSIVDAQWEFTLEIVFRQWRRFVRFEKGRGGWSLVRMERWHVGEWVRGILYRWFSAVRGKWRTRVIVSNWARVHRMGLSVAPSFHKWAASVTLDRQLRRQVVREAALSGRVAQVERERRMSEEDRRSNGVQTDLAVAFALPAASPPPPAPALPPPPPETLQEAVKVGYSRKGNLERLERMMSSWTGTEGPVLVEQTFNAWRMDTIIVTRARENLALQNEVELQREALAARERERPRSPSPRPREGVRRLELPRPRNEDEAQLLLLRILSSPPVESRLILLRTMFAWRRATIEGEADDRMDEIEEASWRMVRLVEAASLRYDDLRLVRQVFAEWGARFRRPE